MALDYGRRRIGVATSDPTATIASPHSAVRHGGDPDDPPDELLSLIEELDPVRIVVGMPKHMDGSEGEMAEEARSFASTLAAATDVPVETWDERLSSAAARRALVDTGAPRGKRREKGRVDAMAATLVLKAWLAARRRPGTDG